MTKAQLRFEGTGLDPVWVMQCTTDDWPPTKPPATDHWSLVSIIQPVFNPPHCLLVQSMLYHLLHEDFTGDSAESLTEAQVDNLYSSPQPLTALEKLIRLSDRKDISFHQLCSAPLCMGWGLALGGP